MAEIKPAKAAEPPNSGPDGPSTRRRGGGGNSVPGRFQAAIFDLDGTLLNTIDDLADSLNEVLKAEGLPTHAPDDYRLMVGNGLETLVVRALPEGLRIPAHVRPILQRFVETYRNRQIAKTRPYPGIEAMLERLSAQGFRLAVLSNKAQANTRAVVEHFFPGRFEMVLGMRPEVPPKPDPAGALEIVRGFGLEPQSFFYLGDSGVDMKTALAAGLFPVGVTWGFRSEDELTSAGAGCLISRPEDLFEILQRPS